MPPLAFVDIETTGLDEHTDVILEVAMARVEPADMAVTLSCWTVLHQRIEPERIDPYVWDMHTKSELWRLVEESTLNAAAAEEILMDCYKEFFGKEKVPMAGSSLRLDRAFLSHQMPAFHELFHYRSIDVSTLKELTKIYAPELADGWKAQTPEEKPHRASEDILASVRELEYYLKGLSWLK